MKNTKVLTRKSNWHKRKEKWRRIYIYIYIYIYILLHFSLVLVGYTGQYFSVLHGHWVSCGPAMISYCGCFIQVCMFFESLAECSLGFTYVCVAAVDITRDVIDGSTLVFFRCSVFRVYYHWAEGVHRFAGSLSQHTWYQYVNKACSWRVETSYSSSTIMLQS